MPQIVLSVTRSSMRVIPSAGHGSRTDKALAAARETVLGQARFARRCHFCDLKFGNVADECEVHHLDGDHGNFAAENVLPACVYCHMPHHLDLVTKRWPDNPGQMIYLPEMTQTDLSSFMQAIVFACAIQSTAMQPGGVATVQETSGLPIYPYVAYSRLAARSVQIESMTPGGPKVREGASTPMVFARMLQDMTPDQYEQRDRLLAGVRYLLPLEPLIEIARQWPVDGGAYSSLDLASWSTIFSPQAVAHGG